MRVRLLDAAGRVLPGFGGGAASIRGDSVAHRVVWGKSLSDLRGTSVAVELALTDGEVYALEWVR